MNASRVLIGIMGLPGTGKTTLALRLADAIGAVVLSKDLVRAALFPAPVLDYSRAQDDIAMTAVYRAAAAILCSEAPRPIILDGRTFSRSGQVAELLEVAVTCSISADLIECRCDDAVACDRLSRGDHPAGNRTFDLYRRLQQEAVPLDVPRLVLDTGLMSVDACLRLVLPYLEERQLARR